MSDDATARLGLPYLAAGQMQKHVTLNQALTRLDALTQLAVVSRGVAAQPASPPDGALYILPEGATGAAWAGRDVGVLMRFEAGGWSVVATPDGVVAVVLDEPVTLVRHAEAWIGLGEALAEVQQLHRFGLGTTSDADNPFAAKLNKALWTALSAGEGGDGDLRMALNKTAVSDVLSLLFQSGYGGRAELGLIGDDDLRLKVSADGATWRDAITVSGADGRVSFPRGAARLETTVFTADGSYDPPAWARWIEVTAIGAGGGGGAGASGALGAPRFGGGGGGAGGLTATRWPASVLAGGLDITVGAGGAGGASAGASGGAGLDISIEKDGAPILIVGGGRGGQGGDAVAGVGGAGGVADHTGNTGGASSIAATAGDGGAIACVSGPGGGGAGGGLDAANAARAGGAGGVGGPNRTPVTGGAGGTGAGSAGGASSLPDLSRAGGGGGGGGATTGAGHPGGDGGSFGAGGGGGGAGVTGPGSGGDGAPGVVIVTAIG